MVMARVVMACVVMACVVMAPVQKDQGSILPKHGERVFGGKV